MIVKMLTVLAAALIGMIATHSEANEWQLKKVSANLIETQADGKQYRYDDRISPVDARSLYEHFKKKADDPIAAIYAAPGLKNHYIVSSWEDGTTKEDYGRRLYLVQMKGKTVKDIDRARGAGDSYVVRPVFFVAPGKLLILAEIGTEYSWGLLAYEITNRRLVSLGSLDAAVDGEDDAEDATPYARVKFKNTYWSIEFDHDLVLAPGSQTEQRIYRMKNRPIVFEHEGKGFVPKKGSYTSQPPG